MGAKTVTALEKQLPDLITKLWALIKTSVGGFLGVTGFLLSLVMVPIYSFFLLKERPAIERRWREYLPLRNSPLKDEVANTLSQINSYIIAYFRGQLLVCLVDGLLIGTALTVFGLNFAPLIGLLVVPLTMIPYIGIVICWIPAVIIAAAQWGDWWHPFWVTVIFIVVQNLEGLFYAPRIVGNSVGLHPMTVIVSIFIWGLLIGGLLGPLLAIPLTATIKVLLARYVWGERLREQVMENIEAVPVVAEEHASRNTFVRPVSRAERRGRTTVCQISLGGAESQLSWWSSRDAFAAAGSHGGAASSCAAASFSRFLSCSVLALAFLPSRLSAKGGIVGRKRGSSQKPAIGLRKTIFRRPRAWRARPSRIDPDSLAAARILADTTEKQNRSETVAWRAQIARLDPGLDSEFNLASAALRFGQLDVARAALGRVAPADREKAAYHVVAGWLSRAQGNVAEEERHFAAAVAHEPSNDVYQFNLAALEILSPDPEKNAAARNQLERLSKVPQFRTEALRALLDNALRENQTEAANALAQELQMSPQVTFADYLLCLDLYRKLNPKKFETLLNKVKPVAARNGHDLAQLIDWMNRNNLPNEAWKWSEKLPADLTSHPPVARHDRRFARPDEELGAFETPDARWFVGR